MPPASKIKEEVSPIRSFTPMDVLNRATTPRERERLLFLFGHVACARCFICLSSHMQTDVVLVRGDPQLDGEGSLFILKNYLSEFDRKRVIPITFDTMGLSDDSFNQIVGLLEAAAEEVRAA